MRTVAEGYGLEISRGGMALCPFHNECTPSAKIYPDALHCFGCGTHVDVIGFTQKMFGLDKPIDAVKKLNDDYDLHIDIDCGRSDRISEASPRKTSLWRMGEVSVANTQWLSVADAWMERICSCFSQWRMWRAFCIFLASSGLRRVPLFWVHKLQQSWSAFHEKYRCWDSRFSEKMRADFSKL